MAADPYQGETPTMRWARFAVLALTFAAYFLGEPSPASAMFPFDVITGLLGAPFQAVPRYRRHPRYRHYRYGQRAPLRPAPELGYATRDAVTPGRWEFSSQL
jgi:hypothetical protein